MFFKKKEKKFKIPDNTKVFTSTFVIQDKSPITYVTHEASDGSWQFLSHDQFEKYEDVALEVELQELLALDATLLELADMRRGYHAFRAKAKDKWLVKKSH